MQIADSSLILNFKICKLLFFIILLATAPLFGQTAFITPSTTTVSNLNATQLANYNLLTSDSTVLWYEFVDLAHLPTFQEDGTLLVGHPQKECTVLIKAKWVEPIEGNGYYWYGEVPVYDHDSLEICDCGEGVLNLTYDSLGYSLSLIIDQDPYRIEPIGDGAHVILKYDDWESEVDWCGNTQSDSLSGIIQDEKHHVVIHQASIRNESHCPVRVLFLYTLDALNEQGSQSKLQKISKEAINFTNQAYRNSRVYNLSLEFTGINFLEWTEPSKFSEARDELTAMMEPTQLIWSLRQQYNADIVIVYILNTFGGTLGYAMTVTPEFEKSLVWVSVLEKDQISKLIAHETSHLFGCRHRDNSDPPLPTYNRAHRYWTPGFICNKKRLTICHEGGHGDNNFIQYYSNPEVTKHGAPTGVIDRNNVRQLREQACDVASFMPELSQNLNLHIIGDKLGCPCDFVTLGAQFNIIEPGTYQYEWKISSDGFTFGPVQSTLSSFAVELPCELGSGVFVQLTLTAPGGQKAKKVTFIETAIDPFPGTICADWRDTPNHLSTIEDSRVSIKLFPNPSMDVLNIELLNVGEYSLTEKTKIFIFNSLGQVQYNMEVSYQQIISIPVTNWVPGVYYIQINNSKPIAFTHGN